MSATHSFHGMILSIASRNFSRLVWRLRLSYSKSVKLVWFLTFLTPFSAHHYTIFTRALEGFIDRKASNFNALATAGDEAVSSATYFYWCAKAGKSAQRWKALWETDAVAGLNQRLPSSRAISSASLNETKRAVRNVRSFVKEMFKFCSRKWQMFKKRYKRLRKPLREKRSNTNGYRDLLKTAKGKYSVSKTVGRGFDPFCPCQ